MDHSKVPVREECVVGALLHRWAKDKPDHPLFIFTDGTEWTFADTLKRTQAAAAGLRKLGVKQGDHVLCWMPNGPDAILTWFGANYLGAVFVPVNIAYRGGLLQHVLTLAQAEVLVVHASLMPRLADVDTGAVKHIIVVGGAPAALSRDYIIHDASALQGEGPAEPDRPVEPWHTIYVMFTSGTTGPSKAVVSTYIQVWSGATMA
ncbi:MAG: acyl--CoA ligase, partial [Rhodospirillaceae bacterium]|nr:acyl--CoA ligase [Rhodospirillaceae bacterium]